MDLFASRLVLSFIATSLIIELTPGPNMAYLAILSASNGRRAGMAATAGIAFGLLLIGIAASMGLSALITRSAVAWQALRIFGTFYLLWLAYEGWYSEKETSAGKVIGEHNDLTFFKRGLITNLLNPKAALFYVAVLPDFVGPSLPIVQQTIMLTITYVLIATIVHSSIVLLAGSARLFLEEPRRNRLARRILSALLALVALWFLLTTGSKIKT